MTTTAATQLKRLLTLIPHLSDGEDRSIDDIALIVGVPATQIIEDLRSLVERYDIPGGFVDGVQIFQDDKHVSVATSHFLRPMRLTMSELCALELGLALIIREGAQDEIAPAVAALERLRQVITRIPGDEKFVGILNASVAADGVPADRFAQVRKALRNRQQIRLLYREGVSIQF
jgi:predicted DNA-binding transcriptional regulator YafY